jgi:hypothetical protein
MVLVLSLEEELVEERLDSSSGCWIGGELLAGRVVEAADGTPLLALVLGSFAVEAEKEMEH